MNISGKVFQVLPETKGEGKNGPWTRQDFVIETEDQYPKKVCISVWNGKIDVKGLSPGDSVNLEINVESREYNGKWYTDVKASGMTVNKTRDAKAENQPVDPFEHMPDNKYLPDLPDSEGSGQGDDLPF
jgi:hypothetical protein